MVPQRPGNSRAQRGPLGVGAAVGAALHSLGGLPQRLALPARDLHQAAQERAGGVAGVHQLPDTAPALAGALLEQPDAVAVTAAALVRVVPLPGTAGLASTSSADSCRPVMIATAAACCGSPRALAAANDEG